MESEFIKGKTYYTYDGKACELYEKLPDGKGYLVSMIYESSNYYHPYGCQDGGCDLSETYLGDVILVPHIYEKPPTVKVHKEIAALNGDINELREQRKKLQHQLQTTRRMVQKHEVNIQKMRKFNFDFVVDLSEGKSFYTVDKEGFIRKYPDDYKDPDSKYQISAMIFKRDISSGRMVVNVSSYSDGSGSKQEVSLFRCESEAVEYAKHIVIGLLERPLQWDTGKIVKNACLLGLQDNELVIKVTQELEAIKRRDNQKEIDRLKKQIEMLEG